MNTPSAPAIRTNFSHENSKYRLLAIVVMLSVSAGFSLIAENLPIGLLLTMSRDLHTSQSIVGFTLTGYALMVAVSAAPLMVFVSRFDRKITIIVCLWVYALSCAVTALSSNYVCLILSRGLCGLAHGVFWSIIPVYCSHISSAKNHNRNMTIIFAGGSAGIAVGLPSATWIGQLISWRVAFGLISFAALVAGVIGMKLLTSSHPQRTAWSSTTQGTVWKTPGLIPLLAMVVLVIVGHFIPFTYITVFFQQRGITSSHGTLLLLYIGLAGMFGVIIAGCFSSISITYRMQAVAWLFFGAICAVYFMPHIYIVFILCLIVWGLLYSVIPAYSQQLAIDIGGNRADVVSGLCVAFYNFGIAAGAMVGGEFLKIAPHTHIIDHRMQWLFMSSIILVGIGAVVSLFLPVIRKTEETSPL